MSRRPLFWTVYPLFVLVLCASLWAVGGYASRLTWRQRISRLVDDLEIRERLLLPRLADFLSSDARSDLQMLAVALAEESSARVTIVDSTGLVISDTQLPHGSQSLSFTPEIRGALSGTRGTAQRYSSTARADLLYVALPIQRHESIVGALRLSVPLAPLQIEHRRMNLHVALLALLTALVASLITLWLTRRITRPLIRMKSDAQRFAAGDFSRAADESGSTEMHQLAEALNNMAARLDEKVKTLTRRGSEQEAILISLREGVIAVDSREHILFMNRAAEEILGSESERSVGRMLTEVIRASDLQRFVSGMMRSDDAAREAEVRADSAGDRVLQVTGTDLRDAAGKRIGLLIVLNDVTRVRRLESVRREFVANVSHELKTPVTSILGYIETLREGAAEDPQALRSFLERITRNTDRLNSIIEDLLALSRLEQEKSDAYQRWPVYALRPVVESALNAIRARSEDKKIRVSLSAPQPVFARLNATLIEQALVNLLDNAIKYSDPEREIEIEIERVNYVACVRIRDHGLGIEAQHLPRIFERFYRVDRGRSREQGGTGLGLAIVKHVVGIHGGRVTVESEPGKGSTFTIHLPAADEGGE